MHLNVFIQNKGFASPYDLERSYSITYVLWCPPSVQNSGMSLFDLN